MYICFCKAITEKGIQQAVDNGADSLQYLQSELGLGTECGICISDAGHYLNHVLEVARQIKPGNLS